MVMLHRFRYHDSCLAAIKKPLVYSVKVNDSILLMIYPQSNYGSSILCKHRNVGSSLPITRHRIHRLRLRRTQAHRHRHP